MKIHKINVIAPGTRDHNKDDIEYNYIMGALWGSLICLCFCILLIVILCLSIQDDYDGSK